nr:DNA mismatch repair protein MutS [bacterium]
MTHDSAFSTPMMQQYLELKSKYPDCLLWFRLGDFYEMFLEQAEIGSKVLGITLTARARGKDGRVPMAGIPYHAANAYLGKLIKAGYKVAICEQVSLPTGKGLVDRKVVRIVTPSTFLDEQFLTAKENNYVVLFLLKGNRLGIAVADASTGEMKAGEELLTADQTVTELIKNHLQRFKPSECLLDQALTQYLDELQQSSSQNCLFTTPTPDQWKKWLSATSKALRHQPAAKKVSTCASLAAGILSQYVTYTQHVPTSELFQLQPLKSKQYLTLDRSTVINLEIFSTLYEKNSTGSLLAILDETVTPMGGRLLRQLLHEPYADKEIITQRLDRVQWFLNHPEPRSQLKHYLKQLYDLQRLQTKFNFQLGTPKDLLALAVSLENGLAALKILPPTTLNHYLHPSVTT